VQSAGPRRAAVAILSMPREFASQVCANLPADALSRLAQAVSETRSISHQEAHEILNDLAQAAAAQTSLADPRAALKSILVDALGAGKADQLLGGGAASSDALPFAASIDPAELRAAVPDLSPVLIAAVIPHLPPADAAAILSDMPPPAIADVVAMIPALGPPAPDALSSLAAGLQDELRQRRPSQISDDQRMDVICEVLRHLSGSSQRAILSRLEESNPQLAAQIAGRLVTFDLLFNLDPISIQKVLQLTPRDQLLLVLKSCAEDRRAAILSNVSVRARESLLEDLETLGRVRVRDVRAAEDAVTRIMADLLDREEIHLEQDEEYIE
jgi:flagellar motor switch protein FliG